MKIMLFPLAIILVSTGLLDLTSAANTRGAADELLHEEERELTPMAESSSSSMSLLGEQEAFQELLVTSGEDAQFLDFEEQLMEGRLSHHQQHDGRRISEECVIKRSNIDFFDISVSLRPNSDPTECTQADQNFLGHAINKLLLEYGMGAAGENDNVVFVAGVCSEPQETLARERNLLTRRGYIYIGGGGCHSCGKDNGDGRKLFHDIDEQIAEEYPHANEEERRHLASYWFTNVFKPEMEDKLAKAIKNELAPKHKGCLGAATPTVDVEVVGVSLKDFKIQCGTGEKDPYLDTIGHMDWSLGAGRSSCGECVKLDFESKASGAGWKRGDYVSRNHYWAKHGVRITARGGVSPNDNNREARIFDTSNPGTNNNNGDPDLGSPNENCGGPGEGNGGKPGQKGENCDGVGSKYNHATSGASISFHLVPTQPNDSSFCFPSQTF